MKELIKKILKVLGRHKYVITQVDINGVKYYYKGEGSIWTPIFKDAKKYKKKPNIQWINKLWHKIEEC